MHVAFLSERLVFISSLYLMLAQAVDVKLMASLNRDDLKKICGEKFPEWISFPVFEQV